VEGLAGMNVSGGGGRGVVRTKDVLDKAPVNVVADLDALCGINEKALAADGATDARGEFRLLANVHWRPAFAGTAISPVGIS
jgi:hypothetical protein